MSGQATPRASSRWLQVAWLGALALQSGCAHQAAPNLPAADLLLRGGTVYDGSQAPPRVTDVVIAGERIVYIGDDALQRYHATRVLAVGGAIVAPGFIDPHTHADSYIRSDDPQARLNAPWLHQGVTTLFIGSDGLGTPDVADQAQWFQDHAVGTNLALLVGFGAVRERVLGDDAAAPTAAQLQQMRDLVAGAMCQGAFGLSSGLFYAPQSFASTDEVVAVAREAAIRGGLYDTHQRDESSYGLGLLGSTREVLEIGRRAAIPVHFSHIKALGMDVHGQAGEVIALIEQAQARGQRVSADQYPWLASGTSIGAALLPRWAVDGGRPALLAHLDDAASRQRIRDEMSLNLQRRGGAGAILMIGRGFEWTGKTLAEMAVAWNVDDVGAALRIIADGGLRGGAGASARGGERIASFNMRQDDVNLFMQQPWVITGSDGSNGHPRQYASFPKKYADYVVRDRVITLGEFIHRSTGLSADLMGLRDRGYLREGLQADVVVFDPQRYAPRADYLDPVQLSVGVDYLLVNGQLAIDAGQMTGVAAGRMLRHQAPAGTCL